jgi:hypothetical protein
MERTTSARGNAKLWMFWSNKIEIVSLITAKNQRKVGSKNFYHKINEYT